MTQASAKPLPMEEAEPLTEAANPSEQSDDPSWFTRTYSATTSVNLADQYRSQRQSVFEAAANNINNQEAAYEAYRRRLDERFATAQRMADPAYQHVDAATTPGMAFPTRPRYSRGPQPATVEKQPLRKKSGWSPTVLAILTVAACGIGGGAGYVAANPGTVSTVWQQGMALASALPFMPKAQSTETIVPKKDVRTAKLEVNDATGAINSPIPLDITALAANSETPLALKISGLPPSAYLTKGTEIAVGEWMLNAADIGKAELVVPKTDSSVLALQIAAIEANTGAPAAPSQDLKVAIDMNALPVPGVPQPPSRLPQANAAVPVIVPAAALPDQGFNKQTLPAEVPKPLESLNPEARVLIAKGDGLLKAGDILSARQFYLKAYELDESSAAYGVGQTYDPAVFAEHNIKGLPADPKAAAEWYGKAAAKGHSEAAAALVELPTQP